MDRSDHGRHGDGEPDDPAHVARSEDVVRLDGRIGGGFMPALPGCIISDLYAVLSSTGSMVGLPGTITAKASLTPLFVKQTGGGWLEHANVVVSTSASSGAWTLTLPSQPNSD